MNKIRLILIFLSCILYQNKVHAQSQGDYRSIQSGNWNTPGNWQIYSNSLGWSTTTTKPGSSRNVTIQNGHTITLDGSNSCNNLTIEKGATLNSVVGSSSAYYLRVGGVAGSNAVVQNDGLLGSTTTTGDGIILEAAANAASVIIRGSGICQVARLRAVSGNASNFSMEIDQDINLTVADNPAFTAYYNNASSSSNDNYTFTINAGKTVKLLHPNAYFHMSSTSTSNAGGNYIYNINGTLDLSNTAVSSNIIPVSSNSASTVTLNITGLLKLGQGLNTVNSSPSSNNNGKVLLYVNNGAIVDAVNTSVLTLGENYLKLTGTGVLKRKVSNSDVDFPIGLASGTGPNFVTLKNSGAEATFAVGLTSSFQTPPASLKIINREWKINPEDAAGAILDISLNFGSADHSADFNTTEDVSIIRYDGSSWDEQHAELDAVTPSRYTVRATGISAFGAFSIQNSSTLPLDVTTFTAKVERAALSPQAVLQWTTQNEVNTNEFIIERSSDGKSFSFITSVPAKNIAGTNNYIFKDTAPLAGTSYYRLRQRDKDGKETFNDIASVENHIDHLKLFPNPVANILNVTHVPSGKEDLIKIVNSYGAIVSSVIPVSNSTSTQIDLTAFSPGFYSLVFQKENSFSAFKFIKK
ncbi:T9SS type A sorting domain-containing protein [Desertivirga xinjiangensis]|uniref:T9SS type A sorting domain-containing protein n=1 Tax=Desertivirga xinjiangensis TaxID=539206 RepID=UPI00210B80BA|nr:T9SS type A sorting domain-containing protein [Pedobacter xinjiangensis]